jgi:hypothetical protein
MTHENTNPELTAFVEKTEPVTPAAVENVAEVTPKTEPALVEGVTPPSAEPEKPDFLEPSFNSVEEQAKAYKEAVKKMHEEIRVKKELEKTLAEKSIRYSVLASLSFSFFSTEYMNSSG